MGQHKIAKENRQERPKFWGGDSRPTPETVVCCTCGNGSVWKTKIKVKEKVKKDDGTIVDMEIEREVYVTSPMRQAAGKYIHSCCL